MCICLVCESYKTMGLLDFSPQFFFPCMPQEWCSQLWNVTTCHNFPTKHFLRTFHASFFKRFFLSSKLWTQRNPTQHVSSLFILVTGHIWTLSQLFIGGCARIRLWCPMWSGHSELGCIVSDLRIGHLQSSEVCASTRIGCHSREWPSDRSSAKFRGLCICTDRLPFPPVPVLGSGRTKYEKFVTQCLNVSGCIWMTYEHLMMTMFMMHVFKASLLWLPSLLKVFWSRQRGHKESMTMIWWDLSGSIKELSEIFVFRFDFNFRNYCCFRRFLWRFFCS